MTTKEWKQAEEMLNNWQIAEFMIDGHKVQIQLLRDKMELIICVYVDGKINYEWLKNDCEEKKKFWCKSSRCMIGKFDKKKGLTKKEYDKLKEQFTYTSYLPYFKSFRTLKSQFTKHNENIEFLGVYKGGDSNDRSV